MLLLRIVLTSTDTHVGGVCRTYLGLRAKDLFPAVSKGRLSAEVVTRGRMRAATLDLSKLPLLGATSALGHKRTLSSVRVMSALPPISDIRQCGLDVRKVPRADIRHPTRCACAVLHRSSTTKEVCHVKQDSNRTCRGVIRGWCCRAHPGHGQLRSLR